MVHDAVGCGARTCRIGLCVVMAVGYLVVASLLARAALGDDSGWVKHVVQTSAGTSGQVNTVVANDVDDDGHVDLLASFDGKVVLYRGPDWHSTVILAAMPADQTGRVAMRGCIHSTLMDVDQDVTWITWVPIECCSGLNVLRTLFLIVGCVEQSVWTLMGRIV